MPEAEKERLLQCLVDRLQEKVMGDPAAKMELAGIHKVHADTAIGIRTLKRLFGMETAPHGYYPYFGTRDILCAYAGYVDWADFVRANVNIATQPAIAGLAEIDEVGPVDLLPADIYYPNEPFRNLDWFRREDARIFFGRRRAIHEIIDYLAATHGDQVILIYGQSGVGKSSFLHAGLLPRLEARYATTYFRREKDNRLAEVLREWPTDGRDRERPYLAIVDQVEAIFASTEEDGAVELLGFAQQLKKLLQDSPRSRVLISFRKEYFADVDAALDQSQLRYKRYFLQPLDAQEIEEAVIGITADAAAMEKYQLRIDPLVPEKILDLLAGDRQSHIAPTLQIILTKLWMAATQDGFWPPHFSDRLLSDNVKATSHFLGDFIDEKVAETEARFPMWRDTGLVLDVLSYFVSEITTATEHSTTQITQEYKHIPDILALVSALRECRLLSDPAMAGVGMLRLAHDALAPLVMLRINQSSAPGQKARRLLESRRLTNSEVGNEINTFRWDADALQVIRVGLSGMRACTAAEQQLLDASVQKLQSVAQAQRRRKGLQWIGASAVLLFAAIMFFAISKINTNANFERSLSLLKETRGIIADPQGDLKLAAGNCQKIIDLGHLQDSVASDLAALAARFPLAHRPRELLQFFPVMAHFPDSDSLKQHFFADAAYYLNFGKRYADALTALGFARANPEGLYISAGVEDSCAYVRLSITKLCGAQYLEHLDKLYLPKPILVALPHVEGQASIGLSSQIRAAFYLAETEVTNFQFLACANANDTSKFFDDGLLSRTNPTSFGLENGNYFLKPEGNPLHPAILNWDHAMEYCAWFGWRLPYEVEWNFAARGGADPKLWRFSGGDQLDRVACYFSTLEKSKGLCEVASKAPNSLGFYDMTGNLSEWLQDSLDIPNLSVFQRKHRGGSYRHGQSDPPMLLESISNEQGSSTLLDVGFRPIIVAYPCF